MGYTTYNCDGLTGGASRDLDSHSIGVLTTGDRAFVDESDKTLRFKYNSAGTEAENVATHPYIVRPDDYSDGGNWEEQVPKDRAMSGANIDITSILNASFKAGRDADNNIDFGTDDTFILTVGGVELARGSATALLMNDLILQRANFKDCGLITNAIGDFGGGAQAINYESGSWVSATVSTAEFTFTFTNSIASDDFGIFGLALTNGGSQTGNWPTIHTEGGVAFPTLTTSGLDLLVFGTYDGGTTHALLNYLLDVKAPA